MSRLADHLEEIVKSAVEALHDMYLNNRRARDEMPERSMGYEVCTRKMQEIRRRLESLKAWQSEKLDDLG